MKSALLELAERCGRATGKDKDAVISTLLEQKRKLEEALRECSDVLGDIPAPHSWPLWTRMCEATRNARALLSGGGE